MIPTPSKGSYVALLKGTDLTVVHGSTPALLEVSVHLQAGELVALTGPNGSGKSTLLDVLAGSRRPSGGTVERRASCDVAYVVQHSAAPAGFPITVAGAVAMGSWRRLGLWRRPSADERTRTEEALERVGISNLANRRLGTLSGGQRQRALVAQALVRRAPVILLDEPTAGVDAEAAEWIRAALAGEVDAGAAVVVATHDPRDTASAHRVLRLEAGRLVGDDRPSESVRDHSADDRP